MNEGSEAAGQESPERSSGRYLRASRRGQVLGQTYRLSGLIGSGGMAEVYVAEHLRLGRRFAVKLPRAQLSAKAHEHFRREAQALALIDNDFVVQVIDYGEAADGMPYMVMELLNGEDLRALLDRLETLPTLRAVHLIWEACQGVAAVHAAGLVHRDLKPENLHVARRSTGEDWCKVLDFGIAKTAASESASEGLLIGTVRYMAPEQIQNAAAADARADVYALGAVLYECLSGICPHSAETPQELMFAIMNTPPIRLEDRTEVPAALAEVVHRALAHSKDHRFQSARELASALVPFCRTGPAVDPQLSL